MHHNEMLAHAHTILHRPKFSVIVHYYTQVTAKPRPPTTTLLRLDLSHIVPTSMSSSNYQFQWHNTALLPPLQWNHCSQVCYNHHPTLSWVCVHVSEWVCMCVMSLRSLDKPSFGEQCSVGITTYGVCVLCTIGLPGVQKSEGGIRQVMMRVHPHRFLRRWWCLFTNFP